MDLTPSQAYATAALFTLALRETLREAGAEDDSTGPEYVAHQSLWDRGGLCEQLYSHFQIPSRNWQALKMLSADDIHSMRPGCFDTLFPSASPSKTSSSTNTGTATPLESASGSSSSSPESSDVMAVAPPLHATSTSATQAASTARPAQEPLPSYLPAPRTTAPPPPPPPPPSPASPVVQAAAPASAVAAAELSSPSPALQPAEAPSPPVAALSEEVPPPPLNRSHVTSHTNMPSTDCDSVHPLNTSSSTPDASPRTRSDPTVADDHDLVSTSTSEGLPHPQGREPPPHIVTVPVMWELLCGCIGGVAGDVEHRQRWYDARARCALQRVAVWLHLPAFRLAALEALLASFHSSTDLDTANLLELPLEGPVDPHASASTSSASTSTSKTNRIKTMRGVIQKLHKKRTLKIAAAFAGGGMLFAAAGGIVAPAFSAGLASAIGALGGGGGASATAAGIGAHTAAATAATTTATAVATTASATASATAVGTAATTAATTAAATAATTAAATAATTAAATTAAAGATAAAAGASTAAAGATAAAAGATTAAAGATTAAAGATTAAAGATTATATTSLAAASAAMSSAVSSATTAVTTAASSAAAAASTAASSATAAATSAATSAASTASAATAAVVGVSANSAAVAGGFGAAGGTLTARKAAHLMGDMRQFELAPLSKASEMHQWLAVTLVVSGWLRDPSDFVTPWASACGGSPPPPPAAGETTQRPRTESDVFSRNRHERLDSERLTLKWETDVLLALGHALRNFVRENVVKQVLQTGAMHTALQGLLQAVAWPSTLLSMTGAIDNAWSVAVERADKAGALLAEILGSSAHNQHPVVLVGYGLGARVIFRCLLHLAKTRATGVIQSAILIGAPVTSQEEKWRAARSVVAGRLANVYSSQDWILGLLYRVSALNSGAAGLHPVLNVPGIENVDVSRLIHQHWKYPEIMPELLDLLSLN